MTSRSLRSSFSRSTFRSTLEHDGHGLMSFKRKRSDDPIRDSINVTPATKRDRPAGEPESSTAQLLDGQTTGENGGDDGIVPSASYAVERPKPHGYTAFIEDVNKFTSATPDALAANSRTTNEIDGSVETRMRDMEDTQKNLESTIGRAEEADDTSEQDEECFGRVDAQLQAIEAMKEPLADQPDFPGGTEIERLSAYIVPLACVWQLVKRQNAEMKSENKKLGEDVELLLGGREVINRRCAGLESNVGKLELEVQRIDGEGRVTKQNYEDLAAKYDGVQRELQQYRQDLQASGNTFTERIGALEAYAPRLLALEECWLAMARLPHDVRISNARRTSIHTRPLPHGQPQFPQAFAAIGHAPQGHPAYSGNPHGRSQPTQVIAAAGQPPQNHAGRQELPPGQPQHEQAIAVHGQPPHNQWRHSSTSTSFGGFSLL